MTYLDIADYFIYMANETGSFISNLKLQKLVYYAQAWYLAFYDEPLFNEDFEAWVHGPVLPVLYREYKKFSFKPIEKDIKDITLDMAIVRHLKEVAEAHFKYSGYDLELMIHKEEPWVRARGNLNQDEACTNIITKKSMKEYYSKKAEEES